MTTATAPNLDVLATMLGHDTLDELDGTVLYSATVRRMSVPGLRDVVTATTAKIAKRLPGITVTVHVTDLDAPRMWCESHRRFGASNGQCGNGPSDHDPYAARCSGGPALASDVTVVAEGLPLFDGEWAVAGVLTTDTVGVTTAATIGPDRDEMFAREHVLLAGQCAHCGKLRRRNVTVLLVSNVTGEVRPVGRSCLAEYTGGAIRVEVLATLTALRERYALSCGVVTTDAPPTAPTVDVVALAMRYIAIGGFIPTSALSARVIPTSFLVREALGYGDGRRPAVVAADLTDADRAAAADAIAVVLAADDDKSSYMADLRAVAAADWTQWSGKGNRVGLLASLPQAVDRRRDYLIRQAARQADAAAQAERVNAFIGRRGERREFTGVVYATRDITSDLGRSRVIEIDTEEGTVTTFDRVGAFDEIVAGDEVIVTGTIANHDVYKGHDSTRIIRVKVSAR